MKQKSPDRKALAVVILILIALLAVGYQPVVRWRDQAFLDAIQHDDVGHVKILLRLGANRDEGLRQAAKNDKPKVAEFLLVQGADMKANAYMADSGSAFQEALSSRKLDVLKVFVAHGANVNDNCNGGFAPMLIVAVQDGDFGFVDLLLKKGADINVMYGDGTPLTTAIRIHRTDMILHLLQHGANVNAQPVVGKSPWGNSALIYAAYLDYPDMVQLLIQHGAYVNVTGPDGQTALSIARKYKRADVIDILRQSGARN